MLLKCALLKRGRSADDLKKYPVRHSLNLLLQKLIELGVPLSDSAVNVIGILSQQHEKHNLRYTALLDDGEVTFTAEPLVLLDSWMNCCWLDALVRTESEEGGKRHVAVAERLCKNQEKRSV